MRLIIPKDYPNQETFFWAVLEWVKDENKSQIFPQDEDVAEYFKLSIEQTELLHDKLENLGKLICSFEWKVKC